MIRKNNKIIIILASIIAVIIISIVILMVFLATDIFKSPEQLFYKYMMQNSKFIEILESDYYSLLNEKKKIAPYTSQGEISIKQTNKLNENETVDNELFKIAMQGKNDLQNQKQYNNINLVQNNNSLLNVKYLRTGNKYALTSDEVVTKYVAVDNNNLKDLCKKMGMSEEELINVPDRIGDIDIFDIIKFTEEEKEQILANYINLLATTISKEKFTKNNKLEIVIDSQTYTANVYTLTLTNVEMKNIAVNILNALQNDNITLNIILGKYNKIANNGMTIESLKAHIANVIEQVNSIQLDKTENININLYVNDGNLLKTEIATAEFTVEIKYSVIEQKVSITVKSLDNTILYNQESEAETIQPNQITTQKINLFDNLEIKKTETDNDYALNILLNNVSNAESTNSISIQISNAGNINSNDIRQLNIVKLNISDKNYTFTQSNNLTFETSLEIEELNEENAVTINNYTQQELSDLITALKNRISQLIVEKMAAIAMGDTETNVEPNIEVREELENEQQEGLDNALSQLQQQEIDMFNEQFTPYLGEAVQGEKVKSLLQNVKTAVQSGNIIKVSFSGVYNNTSVQKQGATPEEIEEMLIYVIMSKNYFIEGLADTTGKLAELTIKENT